MTTLIPYQIPVMEYLSRCPEEYIDGLGRLLWLLEQEYGFNTVLYTYESEDEEPVVMFGIAIDSEDREKYPDPFFKTLQNVAYACNCPDITITWYKDDVLK
jgi:hypothetical protein